MGEFRHLDYRLRGRLAGACRQCPQRSWPHPPVRTGKRHCETLLRPRSGWICGKGGNGQISSLRGAAVHLPAAAQGFCSKHNPYLASWTTGKDTNALEQAACEKRVTKNIIGRAITAAAISRDWRASRLTWALATNVARTARVRPHAVHLALPRIAGTAQFAQSETSKLHTFRRGRSYCRIT